MITSQELLIEKLKGLRTHLEYRVRGQSHVMPRIVSLLERGELGLRKVDRPKGSFLFLGPTGVGKTEITLTFGNYLFGPEGVHRFDMSEFQSRDSLPVLLGEPSKSNGQLESAIRKCSEGVLLFDEIEKAHPNILDLFLQILDAGRATTFAGVPLDFSGYYIVFTSNIGSAGSVDLRHSSFATLERHVLQRSREAMRPELYARINEKLVFQKLDLETQLEIANLFVQKEIAFLADRGYQLTPTQEALHLLRQKGFHPHLGARPMRDAVEKHIGDAVSASLMRGETGSGYLVVNGDCLRISQHLN